MFFIVNIIVAVPFYLTGIVGIQKYPSSIVNYSSDYEYFSKINSNCLQNGSDTRKSYKPDLTFSSIYFGPVKKAGIDSVIPQEEAITKKKTTEDSSYKKYPTACGGDISLWETANSYGYTARGLGQEIYRDSDTRIIEKLVISWLLVYTNQYRKENGLDTLLHDPCLLKAAAYHADYLFNESKKNHHFKLGHYQDSSSEWFKGNGPSDRALAAGCKKSCGENALYNNIFPIPAADFNYRKKLNLAAQKIARDMVFVQWHNSKGHRDNMLFKGYSSLGVAVAIGKHYSNDAYINDKGETILINDVNAISWIAFGVQVMAY